VKRLGQVVSSQVLLISKGGGGQLLPVSVVRFVRVMAVPVIDVLFVNNTKAKEKMAKLENMLRRVKSQKVRRYV
jgi:hypothetical protein